MLSWNICVLAFVFYNATGCCLGTNDSDGGHFLHLLRYLFNDSRYDKTIRPIRDPFRPVKIKLRINLYQILEVDERHQNVELYVWMRQIWDDEFLGWNPEKFGGIDNLILPFDRIWLPDTYLYNSLHIDKDDTEAWLFVSLNTQSINQSCSTNPSSPNHHFKAQVSFQYPAIYKYTCQMNIAHFPFDRQNCSMIFGSWTYDATGIDYYPEFDRVLNESFVYACCPNPYTQLRAHLVLKRKALYYIVNLVVPTTIITVIAIIGFFSPVSTSKERSEKVNLGITTLLAMSILLLGVTHQMPSTSNYVPLIGWYFLGIIVEISLSTAITSFVIILERHGKHGKRVPRGIRRVFFDLLGPCVFLAPPSKKKCSRKNASASRRGFQNENTEQANALMTNYGPLNGPFYTQTKTYSADFQQHDCIVKELQAIKESMERIARLMWKRHEHEDLKTEWELLAMIIDRAFMVLFLGLTVFLTLFLVLYGNSIDE